MASSGSGVKIIALDALHSDVARVAESMGGEARRDTTLVGFPVAATTEHRTESVPYLRVVMPGGFVVELLPNNPLSLPYVLSVKVIRTHNGGRKRDWQFTHGPDGWRGQRQGPLTEDELRECLTPEGPPPAVY
jgi:hypothetical protein